MARGDACARERRGPSWLPGWRSAFQCSCAAPDQTSSAQTCWARFLAQSFQDQRRRGSWSSSRPFWWCMVSYFVFHIIYPMNHYFFNVWGLSSREGPIRNSVGSGSASGQKSALETSKLQQSLNSEIFLYRRYTKYQIGLGTVYFCWQSIKASVTH